MQSCATATVSAILINNVTTLFLGSLKRLETLTPTMVCHLLVHFFAGRVSSTFFITSPCLYLLNCEKVLPLPEAVRKQGYGLVSHTYLIN